MLFVFSFFFYRYGDHRDLHVLTHSFPTRRSSYLVLHRSGEGACWPRIGATTKPSDCRKPQDDRELYRRSLPASSPRGAVCDHIVELPRHAALVRSEEHTSELQSLMRISYAVFCLKKKKMILTIDKAKTRG